MPPPPFQGEGIVRYGSLARSVQTAEHRTSIAGTVGNQRYTLSACDSATITGVQLIPQIVLDLFKTTVAGFRYAFNHEYRTEYANTGEDKEGA